MDFDETPLDEVADHENLKEKSRQKRRKKPWINA
jgi:hypothetical protein